MISMLFTFQIFLLAVGFFIGYWFLITAQKQENHLKLTGIILGWVMILLTIFLSVCNFLYSIMMINDYESKSYSPIPAQEQEQPSVNQGTQGNQSEMHFVPQGGNQPPPIKDNSSYGQD